LKPLLKSGLSPLAEIPEKGLAKAAQFMQKLQLSENRQIRELAWTPLLLHLACSVFQAKSNFLLNEAIFYKQGLDILLVRWDRGALNEMKFIVICLYLKSSNC